MKRSTESKVTNYFFKIPKINSNVSENNTVPLNSGSDYDCLVTLNSVSSPFDSQNDSQQTTVAASSSSSTQDEINLTLNPLNSESDCDSIVTLNSVSSTFDSQNDFQQSIVAASTQHDINTGKDSDTDYPAIWSEKQWLERKQKHKWLAAKHGYLGCNDCCSVGHLGLHKSQGLSLNNEWMKYQVTFNGTDKAQQLKSLRNKVSAHQLSSAHNKATEILADSQKHQLETVTLQQQSHVINVTEKIFNTAYYLAKNDRPFSDHEDLIDLQKKNGLDVRIILHSRYSATEIIKHISSEFKKKLILKLTSEDQKFSVLIDESTTLGKESVLIVYIKTFLNFNDEMIFLDLITLSDQKAETISNELLNCLHSYGLTDTFLRKNLICIACDGASVMVGRTSGVAKLLKDKLQEPNIIVWHCLNHRLELAVHDTIADMNAINHFRSLMDTLYALFSQSPKQMNELKRVSASLSVQLNKIGRVLDTRWVSSSFRSVSSVWGAYVALVRYFKEAANDLGRSSNERNKFKGLYLRMESIEFLNDLALIYDVLEELANLSLQLQERHVTVTRADKLIRRTLRVVESFKENPGEKEKEAKKASESLTYLGICLTSNKKITNINRLQFLTSIVNNLNARCFTTVASRRSQTEKDDKESQLYNALLADFDVLNPDTWSEDSKNNIRYGEKSIIKMCSQFRLSDVRTILNGFREYLDEGGKKFPNTLLPLTNAVKSIPCSTAECERGFSAMNTIVNKFRTKLLIRNVSSVMFIKLNGPPLSKWNAVPYVKSWLLNHRSADDCRSRQTARDEQEEREIWKLF